MGQGRNDPILVENQICILSRNFKRNFNHFGPRPHSGCAGCVYWVQPSRATAGNYPFQVANYTIYNYT